MEGPLNVGRFARALVGLALMAGVCAGAAQAQEAGEQARKYPLLKLGHYSTPDGMTGLVLDRLNERPRARLDGSQDVVELFPEEVRRRGERVATLLNGPEGVHWLRLERSGQVVWLVDGEQPLLRDGDAQPLGEPTLRGAATPPPPPSPRELYAAKLEAVSVVETLGMSPEDSTNLAKVAEAIAKAAPGQFVRTCADDELRAALRYAPGPDVWGGTDQGDASFYGWPCDEAWKPGDADQTGLRRYGGKLAGYAHPDNNQLRQHELEGFHTTLPAGVPGLVWEVRGETAVIFVTLDGGRYYGSLEYEGRALLEPGLGDPATWPAPLHRSLVRADTIDALTKAGSIPAGLAERLSGLEQSWRDLAAATWKQAEAQVQEVLASEDSYSAKEGRLVTLERACQATIEREGGKVLAQLEDELVRFIAARDAERLKLFEQAKRRAAGLR